MIFIRWFMTSVNAVKMQMRVIRRARRIHERLSNQLVIMSPNYIYLS